jgi:hypothetical protein
MNWVEVGEPKWEKHRIGLDRKSSLDLILNLKTSNTRP